ncbi:PcfK-like family protein [Bacteroides sp.]|uniref:PcfK-like family protein n=1 Tax=Bacteroides sp. TaxID=29523 RepID=UPI0025C296CF|nr:PcfK-like family protein [Bacteroides sp.]
MKSSQDFKKAIQAYLDLRAKTDKLFAVSYAKTNKNLDECCNYILGEAKKRGNAVAMTDEEVYGMAVHYYDEDDIKINKLPANARTSVSVPASKAVELTEEDKEKARQEAIKRLAEEQQALLRKKPARAKKEVTEVQQMSLF